MITIETILAIIGALGGFEAIKWLVGLRTSRRKETAEAEESIEAVIARRVKSYEDSITFLQAQLREKEQQFSEISSKYQETMTHAMELTRQLGEMKLKYRSSRCDRKNCENRKPPFRWMKSRD